MWLDLLMKLSLGLQMAHNLDFQLVHLRVVGMACWLGLLINTVMKMIVAMQMVYFL